MCVCVCVLCVTQTFERQLRNITTRRAKPSICLHSMKNYRDFKLFELRETKSRDNGKNGSLRAAKPLLRQSWVRFFLPKTFSLSVVQQVVVEKLYWNLNASKITKENFLTITLKTEAFPPRQLLKLLCRVIFLSPVYRTSNDKNSRNSRSWMKIQVECSKLYKMRWITAMKTSLQLKCLPETFQFL